MCSKFYSDCNIWWINTFTIVAKFIDKITDDGNQNANVVAVENANVVVVKITRIKPKLNNYVTVNKYEDDICGICLDAINKSKEYALLKCSHCYHQDCIDSWLANHKTCPKCLKDTQLNNI